MKFTAYDKSWPRMEQFWYFTKMAPTGYSLTVELDVTSLKTVLDRAGMKFFPAYLWLVTRCLQRQPEFCTAEQEGRVGYYDSLTPLYACFHEDDGTFSFMWTEYRESFAEFYAEYINNAEAYGGSHGILARKGGTPPPNAYTVSCVPWISFKHFAIHSYENKPYYFPSVEAGKFEERDGRLIMPLSLTCHHASTDGIHVSRFLNELQAEMDGFERYL